MGRRVMTRYDVGEHPARLQTRTGWVNLGWRVRGDGAPSGDDLKTPYRKGFYPLYDYSAVEPMKGQAALERRRGFMLQYLDAVARRAGGEWVNHHALIGLISDEMIQDQAIAYPGNGEGIFFADQIATIPAQMLADRRVWAFELGALEAVGKPYSNYRYNEF